MLKRMLVGVVVVLGLTACNEAGPPKDGASAYKRAEYEAALRIWRPLADKGDAEAQNSLGVMYASGKGVLQDDAEAVKWFRLAADQDNAHGQFSLGFVYDNGLGVPEDDAEAVKWYRLSADQGDAEAQNSLGVMYASAEGVPQDMVLAYLWFNLAAQQGHEGAGSNRDQAAGLLTPDQLAEAQRLAREWKPKPEP